MKTNLWLVCGILVCCAATAQQTTNSPASAPPISPSAATPAPGESSPAASQKKSAPRPKKPAPKKPAFVPLKTTPLNPGPAIVIVSNVNVRGQATLKSEVVAHLTKGQQVTVLEEVLLKNSAPDEPSAWAKILLPPDTRVWVHSMFIDADTKQVKPRRLNIRSGPGENFSVLGTLERGQAVQDSRVKNEWLEIEPPKTAYAFVAAQYLKQDAALLAENTATPAVTPTVETPAQPATIPTTPEPSPTVTNAVPESPTIATAPTDVPVAPAATTETQPETPMNPAVEPGTTNGVASATDSPATETPVEEEPPAPRIVQREGIVRGTGSIQAPTRFELFSPESGRIINYLYINSVDLDLARYKGLRIIVTGEEGLDERWRNTPVLTIQKIQVLE